MIRRVASAFVFAFVGVAACSGRLAFESANGGTAGAGGFASSGGASGYGGGYGGLLSSGGALSALADCFKRCAPYNLICSFSATPTCVECAYDDDVCRAFNPSHPVCERNRCVECEYDEHCNEGRHCDRETYLCVPDCDDVDDSACTGFGPNPSCNLRTGSCEACRADQDCSGATPYCHPNRVACVGCYQKEHCPAGKFCDPMRFQCVSCRDSSDCQIPGQFCDAVSHVCH